MNCPSPESMGGTRRPVLSRARTSKEPYDNGPYELGHRGPPAEQRRDSKGGDSADGGGEEGGGGGREDGRAQWSRRSGMGRGMGMGLGMGMGMGMGFKRRRSAGTVGQAYAAGLPGDEEPRMFRAKVKLVLRRHASFIGPGIVASVAYADPGNWATDLQAGSEFGYKLLFAVLLSGLFAILLQVLACRLGIVTGMDLASQIRVLLHDRPRHKMLWRWGALYPLYVICEGAIIATELAELVGSAIALNMLFPKLPLWGGVLVTSVDVFLILFVYRPGSGIRAFELLIGTLVIIVLACFIILLVRVDPNWADVFRGYVPSRTLVGSKALYVSVSILGATVMPHGLFLGSHFSTVNRLEEVDEKARDSIDSLDSLDEAQEQESRAAAALPQSTAPKSLLVRAHAFLIRVIPSIDVDAIRPSSVDPRPSDPPSYGFTGARVPEIAIDKPPKVDIKTVRTHLPHASWDIALSLLFFAITINSAILIVASAAFYYGESGTTAVVADLFSAFELLKTTVGKGSAILFAIALLAAGQSASLTVTLAGQVISEGMINWRTSPFLRRIVTRGIAIIPSFAVAAAVGRDGLDTMLVASQVALSMALPFVVFPLLFVTGLKSSMAVWEPTPENGQPLPVPTSVSVRSSALANQLPSSNSESGTTPEQRPTYPRMETDSSIKSPWSESEAASTLLSPPPQCATLGMAYEQGRSSNAGPASLPLSAIRPNATSSSSSNHPLPATANAGVGAGGLGEAGERTESNLGGKFHYFSNRWYISILAWIVFGVIVIADGFVLVTLFLGDL